MTPEVDRELSHNGFYSLNEPGGTALNMKTQPGNRLFDAIEFAAKQHRGQFRKGTRIPYIVHVLGVCRILAEFNFDEDTMIGGILHDVVEDTSATLEDVRTLFGREVADIVNGTTEPEKHEPLSQTQEKASWRSRKQHTIDFIAGRTHQPPSLGVLAVSCADKLDNVRAMAHDFAQEGAIFWNRFNAPKEDQAWYYQGLTDAFVEQGKRHPEIAPLAQELAQRTQKLFG